MVVLAIQAHEMIRRLIKAEKDFGPQYRWKRQVKGRKQCMRQQLLPDISCAFMSLLSVPQPE